MAHSPTEAEAEGNLKDYRTGWKAMFRLMKEGKSWSGREANCAFLNLDGRRFSDVSGISGMNFKDDGRGLALVDWDHDGAQDVWVANRSAPQTRFLRNRAAKGQHFVSLRLAGNGGNVDGIGARVELSARIGGNDRTFLRTLHAGDGYLSQSTKWIHFGLGSAEAIERVSVRWPDGSLQPEAFAGLELDRHFVLSQGSGRATPWEPPARELALQPSKVVIPSATERARTVLAARLPLPSLEYAGLDGMSNSLGRNAGTARPLLLNLWGSWCPPCVAELKELTERAPDLLESGLEILALSVDEPENHDAARAVLERIDWPHSAGFASADMLDALDLVQRSVVSRRRRLPVPTSFLVTAEGEISVIYKGPLDVDRLLDDLRLEELDTAELRHAASPVAGRWLFTTYAIGGVAMRLMRELRDHGFLEAASTVVLALPRPGEATPEDIADRRVLLKTAAEVGEKLVEAELHAAASRIYAMLVELEPQAFEWWLSYAEQAELAGRDAEALDAYRRILERRPRHPLVPVKLAALLLRSGDAASAVPLLEESIRQRPGQWRGHWLLGKALAALGRDAEARAAVRRALELNPEHAEARAFLER